MQSLINKQIYNIKKTIIPIWHNIDENDLRQHHWLRDKVAIKSSEGLDEIVKQVIIATKSV